MGAAAATALMLACLVAPVSANETTAQIAEPSGRAAAAPPDPLALIRGSPTAWSISRTDVGCYLLSPQRQGGSHLAIGWRSTLGLGLFAVGLPIATQGRGGNVPVVLQVADQPIAKVGRMIAVNILFVPLDGNELEAGLVQLQETGTIGYSVRDTWIGHGGQGGLVAIGEFNRTCKRDGSAQG